MKFLPSMKSLILAMTVLFASSSFAADVKTLIEMNAGKPSAGLAKAWKKTKDGEYEFTLDTSKEVKKGTPVSPDLVKSSLEAKLGSSNGVKVSAKGADKVSVAYTGDETKFLEQVAKTKIRAEKNVELALESSVSEGGIRAKTAERAASDGEVKMSVLKVNKGVVIGKVVESKAAQVKNGATVKVKTDKAVKANDKLFFVPGTENGGVWTPKDGSVQ